MKIILKAQVTKLAIADKRDLDFLRKDPRLIVDECGELDLGDPIYIVIAKDLAEEKSCLHWSSEFGFYPQYMNIDEGVNLQIDGLLLENLKEILEKQIEEVNSTHSPEKIHELADTYVGFMTRLENE